MADQEITALIFRPGFSTADTVTEISGRGVGLDVVAAAVQRLGGTIDVETALGAGTKFTLKLPVSAALLRALLVEVGEQIFALPERQVVSVLELASDKIEQIASQQVVIHRGAAVPLHRLAAVLGFDADAAQPELVHLAIVSAGTRMLGLSVDRILRFQDLFLKELHPMLAAVPVIAGASVLGDGRPVLVLDAARAYRPRSGRRSDAGRSTIMTVEDRYLLCRVGRYHISMPVEAVVRIWRARDAGSLLFRQACRSAPPVGRSRRRPRRRARLRDAGTQSACWWSMR